MLRTGTILAGVAAATVLAGAGCASSERMARLSGGVVGEYSAPSAHRLRSDKYFGKVSRGLDSARPGQNVPGMNADLVNLWPFFFRSAHYVSIFWPLADYDPYGMAIRPFYNHEGDDYAVLFPFSGWNAVTGSGWAGPVIWGKDFSAVLPLAWRTPELTVVTPLVIVSDRKNPKPGWQNCFKPKSSRFWEICLAYRNREIYADQGEWGWLFGDEKRYPEALKNEIAYRFGQTKRPVPQTLAELNRLRTEIYAGLPEREVGSFGFFPLFHSSRSGAAKSMRFGGFLFGGESSPREFSLDMLGWLGGKYLDRTLPYQPSVHRLESERGFGSAMLLSRFFRENHYQNTPEMQAFERLCQVGYGSFSREIVQAKLRKLDPAAKLPETVVDSATLRLFCNDWCKDRKFPTYQSWNGFVFPLFFYTFNSTGKNNLTWFSAALLTGYWGDESGSGFWSVPLLTLVKETREQSLATVAGPLIYFRKSRSTDMTDKPILPRTTETVPEYQMVRFRDEYAACGLYYHGVNHFLVAREGVSQAAVEEAQGLLHRVTNEKRMQSRRNEALQRDADNCALRKPKTTLERLKNEVALEENRLAFEKLRKDEAETAQREQKLETICRKLGIAYRPEMTANRDAMRLALAELVAKCAEERGVEDFGNGLFYRKEIYWNGNYQWRLLWGLAGGEKRDAYESTRICQFLYRSRREGTREETVMFPFIAIRREGDDSSQSFLWRVWSRERRAGKTGGHILFIPYGDL